MNKVLVGGIVAGSAVVVTGTVIGIRKLLKKRSSEKTFIDVEIEDAEESDEEVQPIDVSEFVEKIQIKIDKIKELHLNYQDLFNGVIYQEDIDALDAVMGIVKETEIYPKHSYLLFTTTDYILSKIVDEICKTINIKDKGKRKVHNSEITRLFHSLKF